MKSSVAGDYQAGPSRERYGFPLVKGTQHTVGCVRTSFTVSIACDKMVAPEHQVDESSAPGSKRGQAGRQAGRGKAITGSQAQSYQQNSKKGVAGAGVVQLFLIKTSCTLATDACDGRHDRSAL